MSASPLISKQNKFFGFVAFAAASGLAVNHIAQSANATLIVAACALAVPAIGLAVTMVLLMGSNHEDGPVELPELGKPPESESETSAEPQGQAEATEPSEAADDAETKDAEKPSETEATASC